MARPHIMEIGVTSMRANAPRAVRASLCSLLLALSFAHRLDAAPLLSSPSSGYTVVSRTALATPGTYEYTVRTSLVNLGTVARNVDANFVATLAGTTVTRGSAHFGDVWPGAPVSSADTITVTGGATFNASALAIDKVTAGATGSAPPVADAGAAQSVFTGQEVVLDGSHSTDPAGHSLTYAWNVTRLPSGSKAKLSGATTARPVFTADAAGTYTFTLVVSDVNGSSAPSTVTVATTPISVPPVANAGPDQVVTPHATVTLDGTGSTDIDGHRLIYRWTMLSKPQGSAASLINATQPRPTFVADLAGAYVVGLSVSDGQFTSGVSALTVTAGSGSSLNLATVQPRAVAGRDAATALKKEVTLDGAGSSDPAGHSLTYRWTLLTRPTGSTAALVSPDTAHPGLTPDVAGVYVAQLIVNNGTNDSRPATVVVTTTPAAVDLSVPHATPGPDQTVAVGSLVKLNGSGSEDPEGAALSYAWALLDLPIGSTATLNPDNSPATSFVPDQAGLYIGQLAVGNGHSTGAPRTVRIEASPPPVQAVNDTASTRPGTPVAIPVLANDKGGNGPLSISAVWLPAHGGVFVLNEMITYTPNKGYTGTDQFQYTATDGKSSSTAQITVTIAANLKAQTITFGAKPSLTVGSSASQVVTATSGLSVMLTSMTPSICSVRLGTIHALSVGTCKIAANQAGNGSYMTAPEVTESLNIGSGKFPQTISFGTAPTLTVGGQAKVSVTSSAGLAVTLAATPATVCTVAGNVVSGAAIGVCTITATQAGNATYAPATPAIQLVTVSGISQTITFGAAPSLRVGGTATVTATASSGLAVILQSLTPSICSVSGATVTGLSAGKCTIAAKQPGNGRYAPALQTTQSLTVTTSDADLAIADVPSAASPAVGQSLTFNLAVTNQGKVSASTVVVSAPLPSGYALTSAVPSVGRYSSGVWSIDTLPPGAVARLALTATVLASGTYDQTVTISASTPPNGNTAGNSATAKVSPVAHAGTLQLSPNPLTLQTRAASAMTVTASQVATSPIEVKLSSDTPAVLSVPPSVIIAKGAASATFSVTASAQPGTAKVSASSAGLTPGSATVTSTIRTMAVTLNAPVLGTGQSTQARVTLSAPAPAAGTVVSLVSAAATIASVSTAAVTVPAGSSVATFSVSGIGVGSTTIGASAPGYQSASAPVTVMTDTVSFNGTSNAGTQFLVGLGMQAVNYVETTTPAPAGGLSIAVRSDNPDVLLSTNPLTEGSASVTLSIAEGQTGSASTSAFYIQSLAAAGTAHLTLQVQSSPNQGYVLAAPLTVTLAPSGYTVSCNGTGCATAGYADTLSTSTEASPTLMSVEAYTSDPATGNVALPQAVRGGLTQTIPLTLSPASLGTFGSYTSGGATPVTGVSIGANSGSAYFYFVPAATGAGQSGTIGLTQPAGAAPPSQGGSPYFTTVAVTEARSALSFYFTSNYDQQYVVGMGMQNANYLVLPGPAPAGGIAVTLASSSASVLLTQDPAQAGARTATLMIPQGSSGLDSNGLFYVQGLASAGTATITATVQTPGTSYQPSPPLSVTAVPVGYAVVCAGAGCTATSSGYALATTSGARPVEMYVLPYLLDPASSAVIEQGSVRGGISETVNLALSNSVIGTLGSYASGGTSAITSVSIPGNSGVGYFYFDPAKAGTGNITFVAPPGSVTPLSAGAPLDQSVNVTVQ